jgi:hypothetical protein
MTPPLTLPIRRRHFLPATLALLLALSPLAGRSLPEADLGFLRELTRDVIAAASVPPDSNGGGKWALKNTTGFTLITPGKDTYPAFWVRDFAMTLDSGLIEPAAIRDHLLLICRTQNGPTDRSLAHGLHLPPWSIPDHINYDGQPVFYPGTYASGEDQGDGAFGQLPPIDDHYDFVHIAYVHWRVTRDPAVLQTVVNGHTVFDRLERAFASPITDPKTGLVTTTLADRAVGFGFCDGVTQTGSLLFPSLLRYRAAGELAELAAAVGQPQFAPAYRQIQRTIRENLVPVFGDPSAIGGWLRAATGVSREADVWGTLFALHLGVLGDADAHRARQTVADALRRGTITHEGGVRQVPTDLDFGATTAWERARWPVNTYQNGGYWHTASGWLIAALWRSDPEIAERACTEMMAHLRTDDFRQGSPHGAPWEVFGRAGQSRKNAVYMTSVAVPYGILKHLPQTGPLGTHPPSPAVRPPAPPPLIKRPE